MIKAMGGLIADDPIKKLRGVIQAVSIYTSIIGVLFNNYIGPCKFAATFQVCCNLACMGISIPSINS